MRDFDGISWESRRRATLVRAGLFSLALTILLVGIGLSHQTSKELALIGAFLAVSAAQVALWAAGIRLDLLGTYTDPNQVEDKFSHLPFRLRGDNVMEAAGQQSVRPFREAVSDTLRVLRRAESLFRYEYVDAYALSRARAVMAQFIEAPPKNPSIAVLKLSAEVEGAFELYNQRVELLRVASDRVRQRGHHEMRPFRRRWHDHYSALRVYLEFRRLRDSIVHGVNVPDDERTAIELVDIGARVLFVLASSPGRIGFSDL